MITITPNSTPVNNINQNIRFHPPNIAQPPRFQNAARQNFFQPFRAYRQGGNGPLVFDPEFDGKRLRKSAMRKTVDYNAAIIKMLEARVWQRDFRDRRCLQPDAMFIPDLMPPSSYEDNPINAVTTRFVKTATNKMRCPIFCMAWTPEGRRLVTGASSGEFTLWNGLTFNFETILQAHDTPVRTMVWSHNEMWMVTADHAGYVKYWQSNMNNVKMFMAHQDAIRGISFSPSDSKFASCSDDGTIKIWDFYRCQEERTLRGHGADVKCVHWHPQKGLIISGSKDNQQPVKLWDPKSGTSLSTIHAHKSTVMDVKWNNNGNWFVTASRDHLLKLFDIRNLSTEVQVFRGHKKEASSVAWHPIHEGLFCSGGSDGAILFWHVGAEKEVGVIEQAHDSIVWTLAWHPMGHILCSGSNDHTSKFWTRNRPGDSMRDKYNLNTIPASLSGLDDDQIDEIQSFIPGMGPEDKVEINTSPVPGMVPGFIPGLEDLDISDDKNKQQSKKVPYSKPIPKNFMAQWNDTGKLEDLDDDSRDGLDPMALLNQLIEQQPGVKLVKDLEPEAICIYGKVLTVEPGSALANVISEGGEKLMKYLNSGAVKELRDVIPYYDDNGSIFLGDSDPDDYDQEMDPMNEDMLLGSPNEYNVNSLEEGSESSQGGGRDHHGGWKASQKNSFGSSLGMIGGSYNKSTFNEDRFPREERMPREDRMGRGDRFGREDRFSREDSFGREDRFNGENSFGRDDRFSRDDNREDRFPRGNRMSREDRMNREDRIPREDRQFGDTRPQSFNRGPPNQPPLPSLLDLPTQEPPVLRIGEQARDRTDNFRDCGDGFSDRPERGDRSNYWQDNKDFDEKRSEDSKEPWDEEDEQENGSFRDFPNNKFKDRPNYSRGGGGGYKRNRRGWYRGGNRQSRGVSH